MLLEFSDKRINEFASVAFHKKNDGKPFEVSELLGQELLKVPTKMDGQTISVFKAYEKTVSKSLLPEDFPLRAELEANGIYTMEDVKVLTLDSHAELKGIGVKSMQKILDAVPVDDLPPVTNEEILPKGEGE